MFDMARIRDRCARHMSKSKRNQSESFVGDLRRKMPANYLWRTQLIHVKTKGKIIQNMRIAIDL